MVRTLAGECTASLSWLWGVCGEPAQLHLTAVGVLAWIGKWWGGAHTRRGVHGIPDLTMGVCGDWTCTVPFNVNEWGCCLDWEAGDGAHTRRGVHGILSWPWGVCQSVVNQEWWHQQAVHCAQDGNVGETYGYCSCCLWWLCWRFTTCMSESSGWTVGVRWQWPAMLTRRGCDWWPLVVAPFLIVHFVCVCHCVKHYGWEVVVLWWSSLAAPFSWHCCMHETETGERLTSDLWWQRCVRAGHSLCTWMESWWLWDIKTGASGNTTIPVDIKFA